jgi:hypothetical protein
MFTTLKSFWGCAFVFILLQGGQTVNAQDIKQDELKAYSFETSKYKKDLQQILKELKEKINLTKGDLEKKKHSDKNKVLDDIFEDLKELSERVLHREHDYVSFKRGLDRIRNKFRQVVKVHSSKTKENPAKKIIAKNLKDSWKKYEQVAGHVVNTLNADKTSILNNKEFLGIHWGIGVTLTIDTGTNNRVRGARIIDNIVRVDSQNNVIPRVMLETHYFLLQTDVDCLDSIMGFGPFLGVVPGGEDIIDAIGFGFMFGFKRNKYIVSKNESFNIGVGVVFDPSTQILGDGFKEGQPPPGTETEVRFKEQEQKGILIAFSFSF